jgi:hypothetical protein
MLKFALCGWNIVDYWFRTKEYGRGRVLISVYSPHRCAADVGMIVGLGQSGVWPLRGLSPSSYGTDIEDGGLIEFMTIDEKLTCCTLSY